MKKFKLPRKLKKKLKKEIYFYDSNDGSMLMANPHSNQEDFNDFKSGKLKSFHELARNFSK